MKTLKGMADDAKGVVKTAVAIVTGDGQERERTRKSRRAAIKRERDTAAMAFARADLIDAEIRRIDMSIETATDRHQAACLPLQGELSELEQRAVQRITNRLSADAAEDARRTEIICLIAEENRTLEAAVKEARARKKPLLAESQKLRCTNPPKEVFESKLSHPGVANPQLLVAKFVTERRAAAAEGRLTVARKALKTVTANIRGLEAARQANEGTINNPNSWAKLASAPIMRHGDMAFEQRKLACWTAEVEAAGAEKVAAWAEAQRIHQAIIDE